MAKAFRKVAVILLLAGILCALFLWMHRRPGPELVANTREELRQQGFKTDLSEFDLSTSGEIRAREADLTSLGANRSAGLPREWPDLAEAAGNDSVVVVWKQDMLKLPHESDEITWDQFREPLDKNRSALNAACQAALTGPIRFNLVASGGHGMLLRHLGLVRNVVAMLGSRTMLALHDGQQDAAWTNLVAATHLVTAWDIEPVEISHLVRSVMTKIVFEATWQILQTNAWSERRLAQLQAEWEHVDFFSHLPDTGEFDLACDAADYEFARRPGPNSRPGAEPTMIELLRSPLRAWADIRYHWDEARYWQSCQYVEERNLLLYDRDRELELRKAVRAPTWVQMSALPGVTNKSPFNTKRSSGVRAMRSSRRIGLAFQEAGGGLLGHAAEAEARRRIIVAALALERYHAQHGAYPPALANLLPEFLKTEPTDFMDGQPLRYELNPDGHYRLYSIGLDCVDDGGEMTEEGPRTRSGFRPRVPGVMPKGDIVWPLPAKTTVVTAMRQQQSAGIQKQADDSELALAEAQWKHAANHQTDVEKLLAAPAAAIEDLKYHGKALSELLRNAGTSETNHLALGDMFTLKQIITGHEPEQVTLELPISYDALKRVGELYLLVDANNDDSDEGCAAQQMDCQRAENGDCLLVWDTIFESPGKHALRAGLEVHGGSPDHDAIVGPPLPIAVSNLCQFSMSSTHFDPRLGAGYQLKLPEKNGRFVLRCQTTNGLPIKTITGATTNGIVSIRWNLLDDQGRRFGGESFDSTWTMTLPDSGRTQTLKGP
jgi:hypothetical protein